MKTLKKKNAKDPISQQEKQTDPRDAMRGFDVREQMREIESAVTDAGSYFARMERNEHTRLCQWDGKDPSGRKRSTKTQKAKPWENASDHEVHLAQEVLLQLTALCTAAMMRGGLQVTPMEGTDVRAASQMKLVMRYFLENAMHGERLIQGTRWASWTRRYGHAVMYVGWKTVKMMEKREVKRSELVAAVLQQKVMEAQAAMQQTPETEAGQAPVLPQIVTLQMQEEAESWVAERATDNELAALLLQLRPELQERAKEAEHEAMKCVRMLRADKSSEDPTGTYFAAFVRESRPVWEALRQGVDFFCPPETVHQETFDDARWLYRIKWMSVQQVREEAAIRGWNPKWVMEVTKNCRGKARVFTTKTQSTPWALSGLGVGWTHGNLDNIDSSRNLVQVGILYDRRTTLDGVTCLYETVLHPDVTSCVAKRELLEDWHGHYPFVSAVNEHDEPLLMANRGVPEILRSPQNAIKTQWDSRDDMASLTTVPPWTGPETLQGTTIAPGAFIPEWRTGAVSAFRLPQPDGRSVEIENTLRASVDRYFGLISKNVPDALSQLLGQTGTDFFLASYSRLIALTAQLVQQRMDKLTGARITGTEIVFDATRESIRGNFNFTAKFDVKSLDLEWFRTVIDFAKDAMTSFDQNNATDKRVFLEMAYNMIDPGMADRALKPEDAAREDELKAIDAILTAIFSGASKPEFPMNVDYQTRADRMQEDLQQSPVRQQIMQSVPAIAAVWQDYLQRLLVQVEQKTTNVVAGQQGGGDPLKQSPVARLKAGGWQSILAA